MNRIKLWPHGTLIIIAGAIVAAVAALLFTRYERTASAKEMPQASRIERVDGQVGLNRSLDQSQSGQWIQATANTPVSVGDRVVTRDNSRTDIAFTGRNFATLQANTSLDVLELSNQKDQFALREGSALFDVGSLPSAQLFEVATPCGAVDVKQAGLYQIGIDEQGNAVANTLNGLAEVVGRNGSGEIQKGESLTLACQNGGGAVISRLDKAQAGTLVDSYYRYRYPKKYDGRYVNYDTYLADPNYYDPYNRYVSYHYVNEYIPGVEDLDDYGSWDYVSGYGYGWHPYVETAWAPYQSGYWTTDYPFGLTWVSYEPWGYAPYHYGRWAYSSNEWYWVPDSSSTYPVYSPSLVAFIPISNSSVAWVALGPGDPYTPYYYDPNWQPVYLSSRPVIEERIVNFNVPGAINVVQVQDFTRSIDPRIITTVDPQTIARVRPVLDPMSVDPLRRAAFETRQAQRRFDVPSTIAQRINAPVVASIAPQPALNRRDLTQAMRVETVANNLRNQKLQMRDERAAAVSATQPNARGNRGNIAEQQARERQMAELSSRAGRGDRAAREQLRMLQREQSQEQRTEQLNAQQAKGEQVAAKQQQQLQQAGVRRQQQVQREAARQQTIINRQQQRAKPQPDLQGERAGNRIQRVPQNVPRAQPEMRKLPPQAQPRSQPPRAARPQQPPPVVRPQNVPRAQPQPQRLPPQTKQPTQPRPQVQAQPKAQPAPKAEQRKGPPAKPATPPPAKKKP